MTNIQVLLKNNIVIAEIIFTHNDPVIMAETFSKFDYDYIIDPRWKKLELGGVGAVWNGTAFVPQPYPSWKLNDKLEWKPPTPKPMGNYNWNETEKKWIVPIQDTH